MGQGARGWCSGMTQRDGMGREVGEGFRMGNTRTPVADSWQCMAKPLQYCKVISLQLNKFLYIKKKNFPQLAVIHTVKGFSVVNEADVFLEFPSFLYDATNASNLISGSSAFSKLSL